MKKINLHIVLNNFINDSRVLKETKSIAKSHLFDKVYIAALLDKGVTEHEIIDAKREIWRVPLKTRKFPKDIFSQTIKYIEWMLKIFFRYKNENVKVVHCHDLSALPIGVLFKIIKRTKLIYDAHELETEIDELTGLRKKISVLWENFLIRYANQIIVVSDSIEEWYKKKYSLKNIKVIKNVPCKIRDSNSNMNILKEKFNIRADDMLFIFQGSISVGNGIQAVLNTFSKVESKKHIVFMGYGPLVEQVKDYERRFLNIHYQSAVKPEDILRYTRCADIGISFIENTCLSYFFSLPNKVFEYILSGLPIIVSNLPEVKKIVFEYNCGWVVEIKEDDLLRLIESITYEDIKGKKENVIKCKNNFGWDKEEVKLLKTYYNLTNNKLSMDSEICVE
ncbi:MAG: glycosyltransferase [Candidatus Jettenia sp.]|nr:glycosyltransferase [Candidatus Jettenia sp.]